MAPVTLEDKLEYILLCLAHADAIKPDFHQVALKRGVFNGNEAQKKFKKYLEETGRYKLEKGQIMAIHEDGNPTPATPNKNVIKTPASTPKRRMKKEAADASPSKKHKLEIMAVKDEQDEN